jgi:hypothetical protein
VDGNRTRHARIARITRFEGGGAHQVLIHLPVGPRTYGGSMAAIAGGGESPSDLPLAS